MNEIDNGGPAYPCETVGVDDHGEYREPWQGMTLRDYFAANIAHEVKIEDLSIIERLFGRDFPEDPIEIITLSFELDAKLRYMMADAMIAERDKKGAAK